MTIKLWRMRHRQNDLFICHDNAWQAIYDVLYRCVLHQQYKTVAGGGSNKFCGHDISLFIGLMGIFNRKQMK